MFLRQSIRSDYCAVYAAATLAGLCGAVIDRKQALRSFGVRAGAWSGAPDLQVAQVLEGWLPGARAVWHHRRVRSIQQLLDCVSQLVPSGTYGLLAAMCRHTRHQVEADHAVVIVQAQPSSLRLIDPLSCPPRPSCISNAHVSTTSPQFGDRIAVDGAAWSFVTSQELRIMSLTLAEMVPTS